jgi:hypothetical protein
MSPPGMACGVVVDCELGNVAAPSIEDVDFAYVRPWFGGIIPPGMDANIIGRRAD